MHLHFLRVFERLCAQDGRAHTAYFTALRPCTAPARAHCKIDPADSGNEACFCDNPW